MAEITTLSKRTVILSITAVIGITSLAYLLIRDNKRSSSIRQFRKLGRSLYSQILKVQDSLDDLIEDDLRLIQVRTKTLRSHRLFPGDEQVKLPSLGLINEDDNTELGADIEETKEELIRERTCGFEDPAQVRRGYKELDLLVIALNKRLSQLVERVESIDLSELVEIGDEVDGNAQDDEDALSVFEKLRKRKRAVLAKIQIVVNQLDQISNSHKERLQKIKEFEDLERIGLEPSDDVEPTIESKMMKDGITFAEVTALNIEEPEILAPTEDLEKMKKGISFAEVVAENLPEDANEPASANNSTESNYGFGSAIMVTKDIDEPAAELAPTEDLEKMKAGISFADVVAENIEEPEVLAQTEDLEKMKQGVTFAEVAAENIEEPEVLAQTEDLEKMKQGVTFADVAAENIEEPEVLAPTEDLEKMKQGLTFADVAAENSEESEVLAPTEDLEKMKDGLSFAEVAQHNIRE
ncbi:hypothetical protein BGZ49_009202 [Haplosporangium sp. Z 27]|nr:hypothetical protein BGZ49_009202 [Haplosporangium sp. Z 27]